jgi:hypothetical protein
MVMIIHKCDCRTCVGNTFPKGHRGEIVFGGTICRCTCHTLKGKEKETFIASKEALHTLFTK